VLLALLLVMAAGQAHTMLLDTASQGSAPPPTPQQQQACGSCYGAEDPATGRQCCNSCSDVRTAYKAKAWSWPGEQRLVHAPVECLHVFAPHSHARPQTMAGNKNIEQCKGEPDPPQALVPAGACADGNRCCGREHWTCLRICVMPQAAGACATPMFRAAATSRATPAAPTAAAGASHRGGVWMTRRGCALARMTTLATLAQILKKYSIYGKFYTVTLLTFKNFC